MTGSTVVVDLADLTFMDSSGLAALVLARSRVVAGGRGELVLTRPTGIVRRVLEIVGLSAWVKEWSTDWDD